MEYFTLPGGARLPKAGFGTWDVRGRSGLTVLLKACELGYRLFDTAHMYGNEEIVGELVRRCGLPRADLFITTKLDSAAASYAGAKAGIERALNLLKSDYIDLLLIHEPYSEQAVRQMYQAMSEAVLAGRVRHLGLSNFTFARFAKLYAEADIKPVLLQCESHLYYPQLELKEKLAGLGVLLQSWAPFTEGRRPIFSEPALVRIGAAHGKSPAQIALKYLVQQGIAVIPKSSHKERMRENLDIFSFTLSETELQELRRLDGGHSLFNWY